jgi:hypothetical protein
MTKEIVMPWVKKILTQDRRHDPADRPGMVEPVNRPYA